MTWMLESLVIFLTFLAVMGWACWWLERPPRVPLERLADPAPLPGELPRAGRFTVEHHDPPFHGAGVPFDLLTVLDDALAVAERSRDRDEISRQVDAIMLEVELNPQTWGYR